MTLEMNTSVSPVTYPESRKENHDKDYKKGGNTTSPASTRTQEKDSGYAWVILTACVGLRMLVGGPDGIMGVLLLDLSHRFQASGVLLNVIVSLQFAVSLIASVFGSALINRYGARTAVTCGHVMVAVGYAGSAYVQNIYGLLILYGIVAAPGLGIGQLGAIVSVQTYFDKYRGIAQGAFMGGLPLSQFMWAPLAEYLLREYSLTGTLLIFAAIQLHGCVFGALLRPFDVERNTNAKENASQKAAKTFDASNVAYVDDDEIASGVACSPSNEHSQAKHRRGSLVSLAETSSSSKETNNVDFSLFKNYLYMLFSTGVVVGSFGYGVDFLYLPTVGVEHGYTAQQGAFLVSILGISFCVNIIFAGIIADIPSMKHYRLIPCTLAWLFAGVLKICLWYAENYIHLVIYCIGQGICVGFYDCLTFTIAVDIVGLPHVALASAFIQTMGGISGITASAVTGEMYRISGVDLAFTVTGLVQLFGGCLFIPTFILYTRNRRKQESYNVDNDTLQSEDKVHVRSITKVP